VHSKLATKYVLGTLVLCNAYTAIECRYCKNLKLIPQFNICMNAIELGADAYVTCICCNVTSVTTHH